MTDTSTNNKRIAKNTLLLYVRMVVVMLITLYTTRALLGVLGISDYGIYNVVCGLVSMFGFLNTSMANGVQRFYNYELGKGHQNQISKIQFYGFLTHLVTTQVGMPYSYYDETIAA